jgi:hypothetical protein
MVAHPSACTDKGIWRAKAETQPWLREEPTENKTVIGEDEGTQACVTKPK